MEATMPVALTAADIRFDPDTLRKYSTWFTIYGVVITLMGVLAIAMPVIATLATSIFIGWLLVASAVFGLYAVYSAGKDAPGFWWNLITALLYLAAGILLLINPITGALSLTIVLMAYLLAGGVAKLVLGFQHKKDIPNAWLWILFSGLVDIVLAFLIFQGLPGTAFWAIGLLVGINLVMMGIAIIFTAQSCKKMASTKEGTTATPKAGTA
jgi:uncharacterized membrane protein HdeD (DUF308 family)